MPIWRKMFGRCSKLVKKCLGFCVYKDASHDTVCRDMARIPYFNGQCTSSCLGSLQTSECTDCLSNFSAIYSCGGPTPVCQWPFLLACVRQLPLSINDCKQTIDSTTDPLSFLKCVRDDKNTICPRPCFCTGICEIFLQQSPLCKICNEDDQFRASFESITIQNKANFNVKLNEIEYESPYCPPEIPNEVLSKDTCSQNFGRGDCLVTRISAERADGNGNGFEDCAPYINYLGSASSRFVIRQHEDNCIIEQDANDCL